MSDKNFLGHPRGLATLFMTEFFERFTYYGMRALLVLFLVAATDEANPGFGVDRETAGAIYGLYTGAVFLFSLPGGWIADRLIGQRRAVYWGGIIIAIGNFLLAVPGGPAVFYLGLATIVIGVGLLKPNISAIVGALYEGQPGARRDAGFSIFYMGINLGALIAPFIAGTIGESWNWRAGFGVAGAAMLIGVLQYRMTEHYLGNAGLAPANVSDEERSRGWRNVAIGSALVVLLTALLYTGTIPVTITGLAQIFAGGMVAVGFVFFAGVLVFGGLDADEKKRVLLIALFFLCAALFWAGFEQAATTFNLFAQDFTDRSWLGGMFADGEHPAAWYQSANPIFVVIFAPVFAWMWVALGRRNLDPSSPAKFGLALVLVGVGFLVMMWAAQLVVASDSKVAPTWLLLTYLLHTFGELCLSPVGLSNVTKLSPKRYVGQMMGTWFLGAAVGNALAGLIGGHVGSGEAAAMPAQFLQMCFIAGGAGLVLILGSPWLKKLAGDQR
ncbi:MAG: MFS transporter [Gammaproteobacteria bacterium]|jgi:POT family proton-dependent oligopeptide transporter|nr:MFS transporter [Gammaproteobacteria bacterium]NCW21882.1 MFS transporter [Gammaproteobacteria bacterium]NDA43829.1 MFS transporter [Gammaproteobacteria bacterium]NDB25699.1 MFS transporter [Gammaproteobacteria bacterium]